MVLVDIEMPKGCWYDTTSKMSGITTCPLYSHCRRNGIKEELNKRPVDCPIKELSNK